MMTTKQGKAGLHTTQPIVFWKVCNKYILGEFDVKKRFFCYSAPNKFNEFDNNRRSLALELNFMSATCDIAYQHSSSSIIVTVVRERN